MAKIKTVHPEGVPDDDAVKYLCLQDKDELERLRLSAYDKLRKHLQN